MYGHMTEVSHLPLHMCQIILSWLWRLFVLSQFIIFFKALLFTEASPYLSSNLHCAFGSFAILFI